jgi:hypothetical protein
MTPDPPPLPNTRRRRRAVWIVFWLAIGTGELTLGG